MFTVLSKVNISLQFVFGHTHTRRNVYSCNIWSFLKSKKRNVYSLFIGSSLFGHLDSVILTNLPNFGRRINFGQRQSVKKEKWKQKEREREREIIVDKNVHKIPFMSRLVYVPRALQSRMICNN